MRLRCSAAVVRGPDSNFSATAAEGAAEAYFGGADDWVFFGAPSSRKAGRAGLVSNFTTIGGAPAREADPTTVGSRWILRRFEPRSFLPAARRPRGEAKPRAVVSRGLWHAPLAPALS